MNLVRLTISTEEEKKELNELFEEAKPYFLKVEGREPLAPLIDINTVIPNIPKELVYCLSIRYLNHLVGYMWIFEESKTNFYILHLYISDKFKKQGLGKLAIYELDNYYLKRGFLTAELLVSGSNYLGLNFWTSVGFDKIIYIEAPEENMITSSVELELKKELNVFAKQQTIRLIPVTEKNKFIAQYLKVTDAQKKENLFFSVSDAIQAANNISEKAHPFFINLNNTVIGYTTFVFDKNIKEEHLQYWLWQFMIDEKYQGKGYASLVMKKIIRCFEEMNAKYITLSTKPTNENAIYLYKKFDFFDTGKMNEDEVIFQKKLIT